MHASCPALFPPRKWVIARPMGLLTGALLALLLLCGAGKRSLANEVYTTNHLYIFHTGSASVDVTSTFYVSGGNSYVVDGSTTIQVVMSEDGHIYDTYSNVIGLKCLLNHLYLFHANAPSVDVTSTHYVSAGKDYVVDGSTTIQVVLNSMDGHIYDDLGSQIGFIAQ